MIWIFRLDPDPDRIPIVYLGHEELARVPRSQSAIQKGTQFTCTSEKRMRL